MNWRGKNILIQRTLGDGSYRAANFAAPKTSPRTTLSNIIQVSHGQTHRISLTFGGRGQRQVTVMSYNMENFTESTFTRKGQSLAKKPEGVAALAEVIRLENPDIVGVQEVQNSQVLETFSRKHLDGSYNAVCAPPEESRGLPTGFLFKKDIELVEWKTHSPRNSRNQPIFLRNLLQGTFRVKTPDGCEEQLIVLNAHFKAMVGGEGKTNPQRVAEAQAAAKIVADIKRENPDSKIVLLGDLNFKADTRYGKQVMSALLSQQDGNKQPLITEVFEDDPQPTHRYRKKNNKLDYMFVTANLLEDKLEARVSGTFGKKPWSLASDHLPPVAVFRNRCAHQPTNAAPVTFGQKLSVYA